MNTNYYTLDEFKSGTKKCLAGGELRIPYSKFKVSCPELTIEIEFDYSSPNYPVYWKVEFDNKETMGGSSATYENFLLSMSSWPPRFAKTKDEFFRYSVAVMNFVRVDMLHAQLAKKVAASYTEEFVKIFPDKPV